MPLSAARSVNDWCCLESTTAFALTVRRNEVAWQLAGASACGPIQRQETTGLVVGIGKIDRLKTVVSTRFGARRTLTVQVKPVDMFGNLLGPGRGGAGS
jgi:hypothetical protein